MKQGILFDMDGTLWDSAAAVAASWNQTVKNAGVVRAPITESDMKNVMGKTMDEIARILFPELMEKERQALMERCGAEENEYLRVHGGRLYPGLREALEALRPRFHLYIVSNCQSGYIEAFLDHYGLGGFFEDIECWGNNGLKKGENIALVCKRNALDAAVYIGDIQGDYDASAEAGIAFIHAAYGFGTIREAVPEIMRLSELCTAVPAVFADDGSPSRTSSNAGK